MAFIRPGRGKRPEEIDSGDDLYALHGEIQNAVGFGHDHPFCYYVARTVRSRRDLWYSDEHATGLDTPLAEVFPLPRDHKLFIASTSATTGNLAWYALGRHRRFRSKAWDILA